MELDNKQWDQQEGETNKAFASFRHYLMTGLKRSLPSTADAMDVNITTVNGWSRENHWQERVGAYEQALMDNFVSGQISLVKNNQNQITTDELEDYNRLIQNWRGQFDSYTKEHWIEERDKEGVLQRYPVPPSLKDLKTLVEARKVISDFARRAVALPNAYKDSTPDNQTNTLPPQGGKQLAIPGRATSATNEELEDDEDTE